MKGFLTPEQVKALRIAHRQIKNKKLADRIKVLLSLNAGHAIEEVSSILLLDEVTLRRYIALYKTKGINGLLECQYHGGKSRLSVIQRNALEAYLVNNTLTTAKEVQAYIHTTYGKKYSLIGITKLLHRMGFSYKKPKVVPGKVSVAAQEVFLQSYKELKENLGEKDHVYFSDATHPTHNTKPSYGWIKKGKKNDVYIKSNTGRKRINLLGALDIGDKTAVVIERESVNAEAIIALLEEVKQKQPQGKVYLVLDNARYHYARLVNRWLLHHPRFKLVFLPPYSPNLNIIERLWRFFHQKVTNNHYFESFKDFKETSLAFFQNLNQYKTELETLFTENFQTLPPQLQI